MAERGIIMTIIIGFIVGLVARFIKPGKDKAGWIMTTVLGIVGAFVVMAIYGLVSKERISA